MNKTLISKSNMARPRFHVNTDALNQSLISADLPRLTYEEILRIEDSEHQKNYFAKYDLVTISSYAQAKNATLSNAALMIMAEINEGNLHYVGRTPFHFLFKWRTLLNDIEELPAPPANLMSELKAICELDEDISTQNVSLEISVSDVIKETLRETSFNDVTSKESRIILGNHILTLYQIYKTKFKDSKPLKNEIEALYYCYKEVTQYIAEVKTFNRKNSPPEKCYAFYDLKACPPKFIGLGVTAGNPHDFINKTFGFSDHLLKLTRHEFTARVIDDETTHKEVRAICRKHKPYTNFLYCSDGKFYTNGKFSNFVVSPPQNEPHYLTRERPKLTSTELKYTDFLWQWENKPRVTLEGNDYWNSTQTMFNLSTTEHESIFSKGEVRALSLNHAIVKRETSLDELYQQSDLFDALFPECRYTRNGDEFILSHSNGKHDFQLTISLNDVRIIANIDESGTNNTIRFTAPLTFLKNKVDQAHNWTELYLMLRSFIRSPAPVKLPHDIYLAPTETYDGPSHLTNFLRRPLWFDMTSYDRRFILHFEKEEENR